MKYRILAVCLSLLAAPAMAHITLEQPTAISGGRYKAVFRIPHGCEGSATRAITVFLPTGVLGSKPMPKAGWFVRVKKEPVTPYVSEGSTITERPAAISWHGIPLPDEFYDEFVIAMQVPPTVGPIYFRVLQECVKGNTDWAEIPVTGQPAPAHPAVRLQLITN